MHLPSEVWLAISSQIDGDVTSPADQAHVEASGTISIPNQLAALPQVNRRFRDLFFMMRFKSVIFTVMRRPGLREITARERREWLANACIGMPSSIRAVVKELTFDCRFYTPDAIGIVFSLVDALPDLHGLRLVDESSLHLTQPTFILDLGCITSRPLLNFYLRDQNSIIRPSRDQSIDLGCLSRLHIDTYKVGDAIKLAELRQLAEVGKMRVRHWDIDFSYNLNIEERKSRQLFDPYCFEILGLETFTCHADPSAVLPISHTFLGGLNEFLSLNAGVKNFEVSGSAMAMLSATPFGVASRSSAMYDGLLKTKSVLLSRMSNRPQESKAVMPLFDLPDPIWQVERAIVQIVSLRFEILSEIAECWPIISVLELVTMREAPAENADVGDLFSSPQLSSLNNRDNWQDLHMPFLVRFMMPRRCLQDFTHRSFDDFVTQILPFLSNLVTAAPNLRTILLEGWDGFLEPLLMDLIEIKESVSLSGEIERWVEWKDRKSLGEEEAM